MPISDADGYLTDHFNRVYDFLIKPSCENAGFFPKRADDTLRTNVIAIDIIRQIVNADMVICDLSNRNPNVLYELGIRQSFGKPVTLIKDERTTRIFDIQGIRDIEYDSSLRIDTIKDKVNEISKTLINTYESDEQYNSLIGVLGIEPAIIKTKTEISRDTEIILRNLSELQMRMNEFEDNIIFKLKNNSSRGSKGSWLTNYFWDDLNTNKMYFFQVDDIIIHPEYGKGKIHSIISYNFGGVAKALVKFDSQSEQMEIELSPSYVQKFRISD